MEQSFPLITDDKTQRDALELLKNGGIVVLPTDTLYGFSAALSSQHAVRRISEIKGHSSGGKQFIVLASSIDMVGRYTWSFGCAGRDTLARIWPAPLTAVLPAGETCPEWMGDTIAFRVPALEALRRLIARLGEPVVSTSVNRSGSPPLDTLGEINRRFGDAVDMIVGAPPIHRRVVSTIVDLTGDRPAVLREGAYDWEAPL